MVSTADSTVPTLPEGKTAAIHVMNLAPSVTDSLLETHFAEFAPFIQTIYVARDRIRRTCRGYGFVYFREYGPDLVRALKELDGTALEGRTIQCKLADAAAASGGSGRREGDKHQQQQQSHVAASGTNTASSSKLATTTTSPSMADAAAMASSATVLPVARSTTITTPAGSAHAADSDAKPKPAALRFVPRAIASAKRPR